MSRRNCKRQGTKDSDLDNDGARRWKRKGKLPMDLRSVVSDSQKSDVAYRCSDGSTVHAYRCLVSDKCSVLNKMLSNGMLETRLTEIPLPSKSGFMCFVGPPFLPTLDRRFLRGEQLQRPGLVNSQRRAVRQKFL